MFWFYVALAVVALALLAITIDLITHEPHECRVCQQRSQHRHPSSKRDPWAP